MSPLEDAPNFALAIIFSFMRLDTAVNWRTRASKRFARRVDTEGVAAGFYKAPHPIPLIELIPRPISVHMLQCLYEDGGLTHSPDLSAELIMACNRKQSDIFAWLIFTLEQLGIMNVNSFVVEAAMRSRIPQIAKLALTHAGTQFHYSPYNYPHDLADAYLASAHDMVSFLEELHVFRPLEVWHPDISGWSCGGTLLTNLSRIGDLTTLRRIMIKYKFNLAKSGSVGKIVTAFGTACTAGKLKVARWLVKRYWSVLANYGHIASVEWYSSMKVARWVIGKFRLDPDQIGVGISNACNSGDERAMNIACQIAKAHNIIDIWAAAMRNKIGDLELDVHMLQVRANAVAKQISDTQLEKVRTEKMLASIISC